MTTVNIQHHRGNGLPTTGHRNPNLDMFNYFRDELDEHHDRRERIIKASRDITALRSLPSNGTIPVLILRQPRYDPARLAESCSGSCSTRGPLTPLPASLNKEYQTRHAQIQVLFSSIAPDLQDLNAYRYARQISGGIQEYIEALSFHHYLLTGTLIPLLSVRDTVRNLIIIAPADYILGIFDLVGEIMRFGITMIAMRGDIRKLLRDMRELRMQFEALDTSIGGSGGLLGKELAKKMSVMKTCVEKVETVVCGFIVRGSERPNGWVPELIIERTAGGANSKMDELDENEDM